MSILLDAVSRNKQQQTSPLPDAITTPRAHYPRPRKAAMPVAKLALLGVAVAAGIGLAWAISTWQQQATTVSLAQLRHDVPSVKNSAALERTQVRVVQASTEQKGVTLAGKVALPRAQALPESHLLESRYMGQTADARFMPPTGVNALAYGAQGQNGVSVQAYQPQTSAYSGQDTAYQASAFTHSPHSVASPSVPADSSYADYMSTSAQVAQGQDAQEHLQDENRQQQPVALGVRDTGVSQLDVLRQQVSAAAADVGLETNQSRQDDKLVATFQDALKEVEYTQAAKTPVTAAKVDPIPRTAADDIPRYGQLPAALQLQVPEFNIVAHVYSSDESQRWLNVDGAELQEGGMIGGKLTIIEIRPRDVVLDIQGTQFKVPAI